jgi:L-cysteine S-thiosulfotransferase
MRRLTAALLLVGAVGVTAQAPDPGLSAALRAMQADDTQNPAMLWVQDGQARWRQAAGPQQRSCQGCHGEIDSLPLRDVALRHPAWSPAQGRVLTLSQRIRSCQQRHQSLPAASADDDGVLALEAALARNARGLPQPALADPRLDTLRVQGQQWWQRRIGQIDLACMHCHDQRAGQRLAGSTIPAGHPQGYPVYRLEWQTLGSLQRRLRGCMIGVRAEPFAADAPEWTALELYLKQRSAGRTEHAPGVRP